MPRPTTLRAGDLWTRITLQTLEPGTPDKYGQRTLTPVNQATVWADVESISGRELWYGQQVQEETTWGITIRIWDGGDRPRLRSGWRIDWQGIPMEIINVLTDVTVGVQRLQCKEIQTT